MERLDQKEFKNVFVSSFPGDESGDIHSRQTPGVLYSKAPPTPVRQPVLLAWSHDLAMEMGMEYPGENDIKILAGNLLTPSMYPYAACYGGHQFGHWAGQLGDGRAITLGEWESPGGKTWDIQLKGAGQTAYSRRADGRAVLRSSVREFLMSEAMHYLGVPTTRALSLVGTGEQVLRDMFYDGNAQNEPGAIVTRVAPTFIRFGNFELPAARKELGNLRKLADYTISRFYPHIEGEGEQKILNWFKEIVERTAVLMTEWLRVGFVHGVMNTDNMSILGLTIDYGPYSFVDDFDPEFTPNTTDLPGRRYAFGKQAGVAKWNLSCLAGALAPLFENTEELGKELNRYDDYYWGAYFSMMSHKLGLDGIKDQRDVDLLSELEKTLTCIKPDMTIFYQMLITLPATDHEQEIASHFEDSFYCALPDDHRSTLTGWINNYQKRLLLNTISREEGVARMKKSNPRFILRNYLLHQAIEELEKGDDTLFKKLQEAIKDPYSDRFDEFFVRRPGWAATKAGCSMLSCSS